MCYYYIVITHLCEEAPRTGAVAKSSGAGASTKKHLHIVFKGELL